MKVSMKLSPKRIEKTCPEVEIFESVLSLDNKNILEIGCGDAAITRLIAKTGEARTIIATEMDTVQHETNLQIKDLSNVDFILSGCEKIPAEDNAFDIVLMFKSFHHVPPNLMKQALSEVRRVLKPNGFAYISEPIFAGAFNEILRLFHDEEKVRQAAFDTIKQGVDAHDFLLIKEIFFNTPVNFEHFEDYAKKVIGVTHTDHQLSDELYARVKLKFEQVYTNNGGNFLIPVRVDLLQKN